MSVPIGDRSARLAALLARVALADQRAFEELYRETGAHLYAVVLRIVRDRSIAEEIVQEAYVNVWHHAGTYDAARSQPLTWLTSIVRNRALDMKRRREIDTVELRTGDDDSAPDFPADGPTPVDMLCPPPMRARSATASTDSKGTRSRRSRWRSSTGSRTASSPRTCASRSARSSRGCAEGSRSCGAASMRSA